MIKSTALFLACMLATTSLKAQNYEWTKSFGGTTDDVANSTRVDASGNIYTTGIFSGTVDFDPGTATVNLTSVGFVDIFVQKMDASGNFLWAKSFGGMSNDFGNSIGIDNLGNIYITGIFQGTVDFDPGVATVNLTSTGNEDIFVLKMDASGNLIWAKSFGGTSTDYSFSMNVDASGNIYTTGSFEGTADFDPGAATTNLTSTGNEDIFVHKMDTSGNFIWAKSFGGASFDYGHGISVDASGNVYTTGSFQGTADFDPGAASTNLTSTGSDDIFVQKIDASGNFLWAKSFGGTSFDYGYSISVDASGNIYTTGAFHGTADFDPGTAIINLTSAGSDDIFIQKMDASGNFLWAKALGGASDDYGNGISTDNVGNVYTTGTFQGTVDFDPAMGIDNHTSAGSDDIFIQKMDASGNFLWAKSFGGTSSDFSSFINVDASGNIYATGFFQGTVDFDPGTGLDNHTSTGVEDIFVLKISQCSPTVGTDIIAACDSYTWMDGNVYTSSNNTATDTLTNIAGCDSVVTLDLTIYTVSDTTTTLNGLVITANNTSATYQWLDCNNNYAVLVGETNASFTATQNGSYAVALTENGCMDTSSCITISNVSIMEHGFGHDFSLYPNPTNGNFSIDLGNVYGTAKISIIDMTGKMIYSKSFDQTQTIDLSIGEPAGVYMVIIQSEERRAIVKLVK